MNVEELKERLKSFAYRNVKLVEALPRTITDDIISKQLVRSSFSSAANYRSATRAQSKKQFLSKLNIALEEIDESLFWLEAIKDLHYFQEDKLILLIDEATQLTKILSATKNTTVKNLQNLK